MVASDDAIEDDLERPGSGQAHGRLHQHGGQDDEKNPAVGPDQFTNQAHHNCRRLLVRSSLAHPATALETCPNDEWCWKSICQRPEVRSTEEDSSAAWTPQPKAESLRRAQGRFLLGAPRRTAGWTSACHSEEVAAATDEVRFQDSGGVHRTPETGESAFVVKNRRSKFLSRHGGIGITSGGLSAGPVGRKPMWYSE